MYQSNLEAAHCHIKALENEIKELKGKRVKKPSRFVSWLKGLDEWQWRYRWNKSIMSDSAAGLIATVIVVGLAVFGVAYLPEPEELSTLKSDIMIAQCKAGCEEEHHTTDATILNYDGGWAGCKCAIPKGEQRKNSVVIRPTKNYKKIKVWLPF